MPFPLFSTNDDGNKKKPKPGYAGSWRCQCGASGSGYATAAEMSHAQVQHAQTHREPTKFVKEG